MKKIKYLLLSVLIFIISVMTGMFLIWILSKITLFIHPNFANWLLKFIITGSSIYLIYLVYYTLTLNKKEKLKYEGNGLC